MISTAAAPALSAALGLSAPATLGLSLIPLGATIAYKNVGKGRKAADAWTKGSQKALEAALNAASAKSATDPTGAAQDVQAAWQKALAEADRYAAQGKEQKNVIDQFRNNKDVLNTVSGLLKPIGASANPTGVIMANQPMSEAIPGAGGTPGFNPSIWPPAARRGARTAPGGQKTGVPPAAAGGAAGGVLGTLAKVFGVDPSGGDGSIIDQLIKVGVPLSGAILQGVAANRAAGVQSDAAKSAAALQQPFYGAGVDALGQAQKYINEAQPFTLPTADEVRQTPGYQLQLDEAMRAINAASRGVVSGGTLRRAGRYAGDIADAKYGEAADRALNVYQTNRNNKLSPLMQIAGFAPPAANNIGELGNYAASARASSYGRGPLDQALAEINDQAAQDRGERLYRKALGI
jgi:hypothetical protein